MLNDFLGNVIITKVVLLFFDVLFVIICIPFYFIELFEFSIF